MSIETICIGSELLNGRTLNTNLRFMAEQLDRVGLVVAREVSIPDRPDAIVLEVADALLRGHVVITVGGLGPTRDDMTKIVIAEHLGMELEHSDEVAGAIQALYRQRGRTPSDAVLVQARVPRGATVMLNRWGTAPGLWCAVEAGTVIMLPGPPREFEPMFTELVLPRLQAVLQPQVTHCSMMVLGLPESEVERRVIAALGEDHGLTVSFRVGDGGTEVRLTGATEVRLTGARDTADAVEQAGELLRSAFGQAVATAEDLVADIAGLLRRRGWQLAVAESCTGGMLAGRITELAGVSDVFAGGVVTYSNRLKQQLLGVRTETLDGCGAVSPETAGEMVAGLCQRYGVEAGIAVTGIAGPAGGTPEKPVGLVYVASQVDGRRRVTRHHFAFDRRGVRERTVSSGLNQLRVDLLNACR